MSLPKEIYYDCVTYRKSVKSGTTKDGHQYTIVRYDSNFGTCLAYERGMYVSDTEFLLEKRLKDCGVL